MIPAKSLYDRFSTPRLLAGRIVRLARALGALLLAGPRRPAGASPGLWLPSLAEADGALLCDACGLCAHVCPADCIEVAPVPGGGAPERFRLDVLRCVQCRLCEAVCPRDAIVPSPVPTERLLGKGFLDKDDLARERPPA